MTTRQASETLLTLKVLGWSGGRGKEAHLLRVLERADVVGHGDERLVLAVGDVEPPPLLLLLWEVQAVRRMRHLGLGLQQGALPPLDALLQRLPLLSRGERRGERRVSGGNWLHPAFRQQSRKFCVPIPGSGLHGALSDLFVVPGHLVHLRVALLVAVVVPLAGGVFVGLALVRLAAFARGVLVVLLHRRCYCGSFLEISVIDQKQSF